MFFDPSNPYVAVGYPPSHEQASPAPSGPATAASHEREVEATLNPDGSITGGFTDKRSGEELSHAVAAYRANPKSDYVKMIERWVGESVPGALTSGVEAQEGSGEFVLKARFTSQRFAQRPQARMLIFKAALISHGDLRLTEKKRTYPIVVDADALSETVRIRVPAEFKVDELPEKVHIQSPFGKYQAEWAAEAGAIVFTRTFEMDAQVVPASQYAELRQFLDAVTGSAESPVVLVK
jgi:hypothetical protein